MSWWHHHRRFPECTRTQWPSSTRPPGTSWSSRASRGSSKRRCRMRVLSRWRTSRPGGTRPNGGRETAPGELGFAPNNHHYTDVTSRLIAARMFQVVHAAQRSMGVGTCNIGTRAAHARGHCPEPHGLVRAGPAGEGLGGEDQTHQTQAGPARKRPADEAPVQALCRRRDRLHPHEIPGSALPEPGERPWKTAKKTTVDGWDREDEVEERGEPKTRHQLERMHAVFRNTLLMCVLSFPQFGQFDITREDLESWYEWFYGEDIGGRFPPPEDHVLAIAERNAWRKIHEKMHEGNTLKAAMLSVRQDTLFWTREVYEKIKTFSKGKNKSKGKGKSRGKPGNKGKGKPPQQSGVQGR